MRSHRFEPPIEPAARHQAWCEHISPFFQVDAEHEDARSAAMSMTTYKLGDIIVSEIVAPAQRLERSDRMIARQGFDHVLLRFYESGSSTIRIGGQRSDASARQVVVFDLAQPVVIEAAAMSATDVLIPRALFADGTGLIEALHGMAFDYASDPVKQLFYSYLRGLIACGDKLAAHQLAGLSRAASQLCSASFLSQDVAKRASEMQLAIAIRQYIHATLTSAELGVETITAEFGVSRATLYRLFDAEGGVMGYVRERRLMRAMKLLTQGEGGGRLRVSAAAYATGFSDEKTFSRAFKRRFGCLPREAGAGQVPTRQPDIDGSVLLTWIRSLAT